MLNNTRKLLDDHRNAYHNALFGLSDGNFFTSGHKNFLKENNLSEDFSKDFFNDYDTDHLIRKYKMPGYKDLPNPYNNEELLNEINKSNFKDITDLTNYLNNKGIKHYGAENLSGTWQTSNTDYPYKDYLIRTHKGGLNTRIYVNPEDYSTKEFIVTSYDE